MAEKTSQRFGNRKEDDIPQLLEERQARNTLKNTKSSVRLLAQFCDEYTVESNCPFSGFGALLTGNDFSASDINIDELNNILKLFFANIRREDGNLYKKNTVLSHRGNLSRYFQDKIGVNIVDDPRFVTANLTVKAVLVELKKAGKGNVTHYEEITKEDLQLIYESFRPATDRNSPADPVNLQRKVLFDIMFYMCRRGGENIEQMTKETFRIEEDSKGRR